MTRLRITPPPATDVRVQEHSRYGTTTVTRPVPFGGTPAERIANKATHHFGCDDDGRCLDCDCRPTHAAANYPCGADVPRETVVL